MTADDRFAYTYDAENRLLSVQPREPAEGALAVVNAYDHNCRRIEKRVERFANDAWTTSETHTFVYDGSNIVLERIVGADGSDRKVEYFWGNDLSGTEQGAGGVGGLLAVSMNGEYYFPCYDQNGNVVAYVDETGTIAGQYVYDPYGNVIEQYGNLATAFDIRFSTRYTDRETGLVSYKRRFYRPDHGRWLNRDPIEEEGGENLYVFCGNNVVCLVDPLGLSFKDDFIDSARVISGVGTAALGASIGIAASWTGAGAVGGIALFTLGLNQALGGLDSMISRAEGGPATDNSPIQYIYRSAAQSITGKDGSGLESYGSSAKCEKN